MTINTLNRIADTGYGYDAAGNMTAEPGKTYAYDAENGLTSISSGAVATYIYDANGRRVQKSSGGATTNYIYDLAGSVVAEWITGWNVGYAYLNGQLLAKYQDNTTYFVHADHLGSTRLVTRLDKTVNDSMDFLPYGEQIAGDTGTTHKFTGKERDAESGLDNFGARYDSSGLGRFFSPDPDNISGFTHPGDPQSWNAYAYVRNNPLLFIDPTGTIYCRGDPGKDELCVDDKAHDKDPKKYEGYTYFEDERKPLTVTERAPSFLENLFAPTLPRYVDNDVPLNKGAQQTLGDLYQNVRPIADAAEVSSCVAAGLVVGDDEIRSPLATHTLAEGAARGLEHPKTATAAARAYHGLTDKRFTAWGKRSKVLVPHTAGALRPALSFAGKAVSVAGWGFLAYEANDLRKACAGRLK